MKKYIALFLSMVCIFALIGCNNDIQQAQEDKTPNSHTLDVMENTVTGMVNGTYNPAVELIGEDAIILSEIINGGTWKEEPTDCESDCAINLKGHLVQYNSKRGILNTYNLKEMSIYSAKVQEVDGKSLVLSENDRVTVNAILEKYITLYFESN